MRTEATIIKKIEQLRNSKYLRFHHKEIGVLLWVLGKAASPRAGEIQSIKQEQPSQEGGK